MNSEQKMPNQKKENFLKNLKWYEHLTAGWPLLLIFVGGAIGGLCGAISYIISAKLFNSKIPKASKYLFSILIGIVFIGIWFLLVMILVKIFPGIAKR